MKSPNDTRKQHHHSLKIPPQACVQIMRAESFSVVCHVSVCDYPLLLFFCPPPLLAAKNKFYKVPVYYKTCLICT